MNPSLKLKKMIAQQIKSRGIKDEKVIQAFMKVPRHFFVPENLVSLAYSDRPLPIGEGQTISQPYMVALMTELLDLKDKDKVLEIGTGSGYQTAILAELAREVYTIERIATLLERAIQILEKLKYKNIHFKLDDGSRGWIDFAPYDNSNRSIICCRNYFKENVASKTLSPCYTYDCHIPSLWFFAYIEIPSHLRIRYFR